jgi:hypothetical protein
MAAAILLSARTSDGSETVPSDAIISDFQDGIDAACVGTAVADESIGFFGALIYEVGPQYKP